jgi:hypothetical protein
MVMKNIIFWDITPCSPLSVNRCFGGTYRLHLQGRRNKFSKKAGGKQNILAELISSTPKMEAICSSETSVETQRTARRHIPEDDTLELRLLPHSITCSRKVKNLEIIFGRIFLYNEHRKNIANKTLAGISDMHRTPSTDTMVTSRPSSDVEEVKLAAARVYEYTIICSGGKNQQALH